ncbi:hypothetical protein AVEN_176330-1 [Araneus ventricosus]|uniref:Uncharacterized protein n=1 Tax=Araneus ventricosus TaxID=182803 RepID=A0A4Y2RT91_ARAVE|nr:hypothetical protein AVEN_176330-1 [Araneus ventricosus]
MVVKMLKVMDSKALAKTFKVRLKIIESLFVSYRRSSELINSVQSILADDLGMRCVFAKFVLKIFSADRKKETDFQQSPMILNVQQMRETRKIICNRVLNLLAKEHDGIVSTG